MAARRSAVSTVWRSSIARVVGPTPPSRGVIQPATSAHASSTSGTTLRPCIVAPGPTTAAPGRTMSGVRIDGRPAAATMMSASFVYWGRKCVPVWQTVIVAFAFGSFKRQQVRERPPDREAAPDDDDVLALDRHLVHHEQRLDPERRARPGCVGHSHDELAQVDRVQAVGVLVGIDREECGLGVEMLG